MFFPRTAYTALLLGAVKTDLLAMAQQLVSPNVLVYTATAGFRHDSIPTAIETLKQLGPDYNVTFTFSEDQGMFTTETLAGFDAVLFVHTTDAMTSDNRDSTQAVIDATGASAYQTWLQSGGVYAGVHAASSCMYDSSFYEQEVGALFDYHPALQNATFIPLDTTHPSMTQIPAEWNYEEEVYFMRSDPTANGAVVLMTVDESSFTNPGNGSTGDYTIGSPHPISWYQENGAGATPLASNAPRAGRSFYTALGHLNSTWEDPIFQSHVMGGLVWALEGGSTKAYNADAIVGAAVDATLGGSSTGSAEDATATSSASAATATSPAQSTSAAASGTAASSKSATASSAAASSTTSSASGAKAGASKDLAVKGGAAAVAISVGMALLV